MEHYLVQPCSGMRIDVQKGRQIEITDVEGGQVLDFFAQLQGHPDEFTSPGVTIDCNDSLRLKIGDTIYSTKYTPMFRVIADDVQEHDLIHPCCRPEMYDFFYHNGGGHSNCLDNINGALGTAHPVIQPINLFMYTRINADGSIKVCPPKSKAGDKIVLEALEDVTLGVAACSVSESSCNIGGCSAIQIVVK